MWLWWAPFVAVTLHVTEEFAFPGGFGDWDRAYRPAIRGSITPRLHVVINLLLVALCISVGLAGFGDTGAVVGSIRLRSAIPSGLAAASWLALGALLFSNAIFHIVGTIQSRRYSPGVMTGVVVYIPLGLFGAWRFIQGGSVSVVTALAAVVLGGSYHLWASIGHALRVRREAAEQGDEADEA